MLIFSPSSAWQHNPRQASIQSAKFAWWQHANAAQCKEGLGALFNEQPVPLGEISNSYDSILRIGREAKSGDWVRRPAKLTAGFSREPFRFVLAAAGTEAGPMTHALRGSSTSQDSRGTGRNSSRYGDSIDTSRCRRGGRAERRPAPPR